MEQPQKGLIELGWFGETPIATIVETTSGYYVMTMDGEEIGGTNYQRLQRWAKKQGYKVGAPVRYQQNSILSHGFDK